MKLKLIYVFSFLVFCLGLIVNLILIYKNSTITTTHNQTSKVSFYVIDKQTKNPIANAKICIPEYHIYTSTNKNGQSNKVEIPFFINEAYSNVKTNWQYITILAYKNGYTDCIMFNVKSYNQQERIGIIIELSEIVSTDDYEPNISFELPPTEYTNKLIKTYKK